MKLWTDDGRTDDGACLNYGGEMGCEIGGGGRWGVGLEGGRWGVGLVGGEMGCGNGGAGRGARVRNIFTKNPNPKKKKKKKLFLGGRGRGR